MAILTVIIGIIFVLLLLSLLATSVMELLASFFHLRGRNLTKALHNMLASNDKSEALLNAFKENSLYKHLSQQYSNNVQGPPSYIDAKTFQSILFDIILKEDGVENLKARIDELPDEDLKNVLNQLLRDADNEMGRFKASIEKWYNDVMDRASGWYKRYTQKILIGVGVAIALIFNADTFAIYNRLESDPETLQQVVALAENYVNNREDILNRPVDPSFEQSLDNLESFINTEINSVKSPLGLGWSEADFSNYNTYDWLAKILGYIVTALAISMGAPFWFDLLNKLVNIRSSGNKP
jgi:hypothetical protein